ncbi:MAG: alpha/beta fold hydrolase [Candidatus Saganbacteria bacterium]|nr:alpha/beta fold hydrolase [Candidatus Saganbacteria bacterium]
MQVVQLIKEDGIEYIKSQCDDPQAVLLLVHGLGAHTGRWQFLSEYFKQNNVSSYAVELKGFGRTKGLKGHIDSLRTYYKDILLLYKMIKKDHPGKKIFILGESMGALISFMIAISYGDLFDGLICISPAFASRIKFPPGQMISILLSVIFAPRKQFIVPFNSKMCTRDTQYQNVMDQNPDEHRFATPRLLLEIIFAQILSAMNAKKIKIPVLFLLAGDDKDTLVDPPAAKKIFKKLKVDDKKLIQYPEMLHALSIEKGREKVFDDIMQWLKKED